MSALLETRYTRVTPDAWTELHDLTAEQTAAHGFSVEAATVVCGAIDRLDDESLDVVRYYGLGLPMPLMSAELADETTANTLVDDIGDYLWSQSLGLPDREQHGLKAGDLVHLEAGSRIPPVLQLARRAMRSLPVAERLLVNALHEASVVRRPSPIIIKDMPAPRDTDAQARNAVKLEPAARILGNALFGGSSTVMYYALHAARTGRIEPYALPRHDTSPAIRQYMSDDDIRALEIGHVAKFAAMLRLDELSGQDPYLESLLFATGDPTSPLDIRTDWIRQRPGPRATNSAGQPVVLHEQRLRCPARQVGGLIDRIVELQKEVIVDAAGRS